MDTKFVEQAVDACGTQAELAKRVNVSQQMVWQWVNGRRPVPAKHCIPIEVATDGAISRHDLRPDVFGPPPADASADGAACADAQKVA